MLFRSFIATLFTIARSWKQPKCPSTDEWIKKMWYIYTIEYYSAIKRNEMGSFVEMWMDLESVIQIAVSQKEKTIIPKDTCTAVFIAALFTIARTWKQPKCPSTEEWIKKMWYIHTIEYYSAIKRNEIGSFVEMWKDIEKFWSRTRSKFKNVFFF